MGYRHWAKEQAVLRENRTDLYYQALFAGDEAARVGQHDAAVNNYQQARQMAVLINLPAADINEIDNKMARSAQAEPSKTTSQVNDGKKQANNDGSIYKSLVGTPISICGTSYRILPETFQHYLHKKAIGQFTQQINLVLHEYQYSLATYKPILERESGAQIDYLASVLKCHPNLKVTLGVHLNTAKKNKIGEYRTIKFAGELKKALIKKGVPAYQMTTKDFGLLAPIPTNIKDKTASPVRIFVSAK